MTTAAATPRRNLAAERLAYGPGANRPVRTCPDCGVPLSGLFPFESARTGRRNHTCKPERR